MIQPGMMFGGEGPVMNGTWYNPSTGDAFTVRDSFFEDNQYVITTTDGRYLRYDQIQNYIQSDMKLEDLKRINNSQENTKIKEQLPPEVSNLIDTDDSIIKSEASYNDLLLPEDEIYVNNAMNKTTSFGNINNPTKPTIINYVKDDIEHISTNMNTTIIEKALKNTDKPNFGIDVKWDKFPSKEIEMLKDIMEIPEDEIVEWYLDNIQLDEFILAFKIAIKERLSKENKLSEVESIKVLETIKSNDVNDEKIVNESIEAPAIDELYKDDAGDFTKETKKSSKRVTNKKK